MATKIPAFTYTGAHTEKMIGSYWVIFLTTSGTLRFSYDHEIDVTVLGGGGGGGAGNASNGAGGGGGYQTIKYGVNASKGTDYPVVIGTGGSVSTTKGGDGGASSAFGYSADGGKGGGYGDSNSTLAQGGAGGTGSGGSRDSNGGSNTVYAFSNSAFPLYGGGGGAGMQTGGSPYGGRGGEYSGDHEGEAGRGYGGGGRRRGSDANSNNYGGKGYQGVVVIRGARDDQLPVKFDGTALTQMIFNGSEVKSLIFNGTKLFMERVRRCADWSKPKTRFVLREA